VSRKDKAVEYDPLQWLHDEAGGREEKTEAECGSEAEPAIVSISAEEEGDVVAVDSCFVLDGHIQIMDVAVLKRGLDAWLAQEGDHTLVAESELTIDGAGVQLLLALAVQADEIGVEVKWREIPETVREAARLMNAEKILFGSAS